MTGTLFVLAPDKTLVETHKNIRLSTEISLGGEKFHYLTKPDHTIIACLGADDTKFAFDGGQILILGHRKNRRNQTEIFDAILSVS